MIRIAIVEDERSYQEHLIRCLMRYEEEEQIKIQVQIFADGAKFMDAYALGNQQWDIIFLDIKMKDKDGIQTAQEIREQDKDVVIIFITTMAQYAIKGYEVNALDFVLKPVSYGQFVLKMRKALNAVKKKEVRYLLLTEGDRKDKVGTDQILYMEVKNHSVFIITTNHTYVMRSSMKQLEKIVEGLAFSRCSAAFLVNLQCIKKIQRDEVIMDNGDVLVITRTRKKEFLEAFSNYLGESYRS